jgi:hypothetical protein
MDFDTCLAQAWADHADDPHAVAERLPQLFALAEQPAQLQACAHLAAHVLGEHLGRWSQGLGVLDVLAHHPACDTAGRHAVARQAAALRVASGEHVEATGVQDDDRIAALGLAAGMLAGRGACVRALATYREALALAEAGLSPGSPAARALAVSGNNLAATLEEHRDRDAAVTAGMVATAEAALHWWRIAGGWLEEERAEYRLARSLLAAERPAEALLHGQRCAALCEAHEAPAFERFFAAAVQALALRAAGDGAAYAAARQQALLQHDAVPADERRWCEAELRELTA